MHYQAASCSCAAHCIVPGLQDPETGYYRVGRAEVAPGPGFLVHAWETGAQVYDPGLHAGKTMPACRTLAAQRMRGLEISHQASSIMLLK